MRERRWERRASIERLGEDQRHGAPRPACAGARAGVHRPAARGDGTPGRHGRPGGGGGTRARAPDPGPAQGQPVPGRPGRNLPARRADRGGLLLARAARGLARRPAARQAHQAAERAVVRGTHPRGVRPRAAGRPPWPVAGHGRCQLPAADELAAERPGDLAGPALARGERRRGPADPARAAAAVRLGHRRLHHSRARQPARGSTACSTSFRRRPSPATRRWSCSSSALPWSSPATWLAPPLLRGYASLARWVLAPSAQAELERRVAHLARTRSETLDTGAAELRRIERDLHDGAQARLVAMG